MLLIDAAKAASRCKMFRFAQHDGDLLVPSALEWLRREFGELSETAGRCRARWCTEQGGHMGPPLQAAWCSQRRRFFSVRYR